MVYILLFFNAQIGGCENILFQNWLKQDINWSVKLMRQQDRYDEKLFWREDWFVLCVYWAHGSFPFVSIRAWDRHICASNGYPSDPAW